MSGNEHWIVGEMDLVERLGEVPPLRPEVSASAMAALAEAMAAEAGPASVQLGSHPPVAGRRRRGGNRRRVLAGAAGVAAASVALAGSLAAAGVFGTSGSATSRVTGRSAIGTKGAAIGANGAPTGAKGHAPASTPLSKRTAMIELASVSLAQPTSSARYVMRTETDTTVGTPGHEERTAVIDTQTGASTYYQQQFSATGAPLPPSIPPVLTFGPGTTATTSFLASLPTDPTALRAELLQLATTPSATTKDPTFFGLTADEYVSQQADRYLWDPNTPSALRAALFEVLATLPGYTTARGTAPDGQSAIVMSFTYTGANPETNVYYMDPSTGSLLAETYEFPGSASPSTTAVFGPTTYSTTVPPDPYSG